MANEEQWNVWIKPATVNDSPGRMKMTAQEILSLMYWNNRHERIPIELPDSDDVRSALREHGIADDDALHWPIRTDDCGGTPGHYYFAVIEPSGG